MSNTIKVFNGDQAADIYNDKNDLDIWAGKGFFPKSKKVGEEKKPVKTSEKKPEKKEKKEEKPVKDAPIESLFKRKVITKKVLDVLVENGIENISDLKSMTLNKMIELPLVDKKIASKILEAIK